LKQDGAEPAQDFLQESLEIRRELGDQQGIAASLHGLGDVATAQGRLDDARSLHRESLAIRQALGDKGGIADGLESLAGVAAVQEYGQEAARLFSAAAALREELGAPLPLAEQAEHERQVASVRAAIGEERWAAAWAEGRALPLEQLVPRVLEKPAEP